MHSIRIIRSYFGLPTRVGGDSGLVEMGEPATINETVSTVPASHHHLSHHPRVSDTPLTKSGFYLFYQNLFLLMGSLPGMLKLRI
jgi:hypothetical protein